MIVNLQYEDHRRKWDVDEFTKIASDRLNDERTESEILAIKIKFLVFFFKQVFIFKLQFFGLHCIL